MLNLNCVICAELFAQSDEVYVTICGHMFHHTCLMQWLERSKTCPQCRNKCTTRNIWRVYFNLANLDVSRIDVGSLQEQLDNANLAMKVKDKECTKLEQQMKELKETQKKCLKTIAGLEQKLQKNDFLVCSYVEQINILKSDAKVVDELRKENKTLKQQIQAMEDLSAIMKANAGDAERMLKNECNPQTLASWVSILKRELRQCENKKTELRNVLKVVQSDLRKELELKRKFEERISQLESDFYQAQEKLKALDSQPITILDSPNSIMGLKNNVLALKREERRSTISPTIKENIKRIEESTSPYLNIKSSSVGLGTLLKSKSALEGLKLSPIRNGTGISMTTGAVRKASSHLSEKYSILKKPRLLLGGTTTTMKPLSSNFVFNGFGGSEKIDPFAERAEEEAVATTSKPIPKNINDRLKAGALRNFKLSK
ncbi:E3 ubiquitin-protein ligase TRAIP [Scaptodrosophila lebanonensis]|uniref:E3 ubiquitin-protein ligase TRAIP n=1 Tax=Drosophila lebanonensis TaxID=7225 RepID=A0A6J2UIA2_DROLE|nr:E3 ubiquitin-protein ligase TRAIP [Scaptodrosophila lebanonensis]